MNLQYIADSAGKTTGIFIPIKDWNLLKNKYKELEEEETNLGDIPSWHKEIIKQRLDSYKKNPEQAIDFDRACDDIEKEL